MKIITGVLASVAALGLLSACGSDNKLSVPTAPQSDATLPSDVTLPEGLTIPSDITIPDGATIPSNISIPTAAIDAMIAQFEAAGLKVDRGCFENLLKDEQLRKLIEAGNTPSADVITKFMACFKQ